jgi:hypothetical protein
MARVFTGWSFADTTGTNLATFRSSGDDNFKPMVNFASFHDTGVKDLGPVLPTPLPANQTGPQDLKLALDALASHANTAPFVARLLIQRLVTSNPSPAYIYRVGKIFSDNASASNQLALVVRAILTDYEARSPALVSTQSFGKLKEPLLRLTQLMRAFGASSPSGRFAGFANSVDGVPMSSTTPNPYPSGGSRIGVLRTGFGLLFPDFYLAQAPLRAQTVFNFYHPDYVLPGPLAAAGLVAPEFEITDDNSAIRTANLLNDVAFGGNPQTPAAAPFAITLNLTTEQAFITANNLSGLLDHLNLVLCAGHMPAATKTRIATALTSLATFTGVPLRATSAVILTVTSPAGAVQK